MFLKIHKTFKVEFYLISRFQCVVNKRNVGFMLHMSVCSPIVTADMVMLALSNK